MIYDQDLIKKYIINYYKTLLGTENSRMVTLDPNL
jgi:hypothetical protein